jgi:hypothetical protein
MLRRADLHESNHQLESRVREIRLPGSEGGAILISRPYPYPRLGGASRGCHGWSATLPRASNATVHR